MGNALFLPLHRPLEAKRAGAPWTPGPSWRTPHTSRGGPVPLHTAQYLKTRPPKARGLLLIKKQDISSFLPISWFVLGDQPSPSRCGRCRQSPSAAGWVPASRGGQARWVQHEPHLLSAAAVAVRPWEVLQHKITLMAGGPRPQPDPAGGNAEGQHSASWGRAGWSEAWLPPCGPRSGLCGGLALEPERALSRPTPGIPSAVPRPPRAPAPALAIQPRTQNLPQRSTRCAEGPSSCLCDNPPTRVSACENRPCWAYLVPAVWALGIPCLPYGLTFRGRQQTDTRMDHVRRQGGAGATRTDGHWDSDATLGRWGRASLRS